MKYRYSILTYNFGKYEAFHEVENPQDDVEYVYVTDDVDLKSDTWKIIVDESLNNLSPFDKCYAVRFNPFKYCSTDICIRIDGSVIVKSSPDKIIEKFNDEGYDLAVCVHPIRYNLIEEYKVWVTYRGYPVDQANKCLRYMATRGYNFDYKSMIQENIVIQRKCKQNDDIDRLTYSLLKYLGSENEIERVDQTITSYVLNTHFENEHILPLSENIVHSSVFCWCFHGSNVPNISAAMTHDQKYLTKGFLFNKETDLYTIE